MGVPSEEELAGLLLHQRIRQTREGLELSQAKFAARLGVSERTVKRWEGGAVPHPDTGKAIAELAERPSSLFIPSPAEIAWLVPGEVVDEIRGRLAALEATLDDAAGSAAESFDRIAEAIARLEDQLRGGGDQRREGL